MLCLTWPPGLPRPGGQVPERQTRWDDSRPVHGKAPLVPGTMVTWIDDTAEQVRAALYPRQLLGHHVSWRWPHLLYIQHLLKSISHGRKVTTHIFLYKKIKIVTFPPEKRYNSLIFPAKKLQIVTFLYEKLQIVFSHKSIELYLFRIAYFHLFSIAITLLNMLLFSYDIALAHLQEKLLTIFFLACSMWLRQRNGCSLLSPACPGQLAKEATEWTLDTVDSCHTAGIGEGQGVGGGGLCHSFGWRLFNNGFLLAGMLSW